MYNLDFTLAEERMPEGFGHVAPSALVFARSITRLMVRQAVVRLNVQRCCPDGPLPLAVLVLN